MVVEWVLGVLVTLWEAITSALPSFDPPSWFTNSSGLLASVFVNAAAMGSWVPVGLGLTVVAAILTCVVIGFAIKAVRIGASFLTAGGGSAG